MTQPVVPEGQKIAAVLADLVAGRNTEHLTFAEAEQQIREIIAQELERKATGRATTRIEQGVYVPDGQRLLPADWFRAAANTVRGAIPITAEQWEDQSLRMARWFTDRINKEKSE